MTSTQNDLRIVLIGKTGNGKSSTGNSLLHSRSAFHSVQSAKSITRNCEVKMNYSTDINEQQKKLIVVDTPGFFDTDLSIDNKMVEQTITSQIFNMTSPGVHAFLIILRVDRFTPEEKHTVEFIKTIFGSSAARYCIIVFTREDQLDEGQTIDDFIKSSQPLQELVDICGDRKFAINNKLNGQQLENKIKQLIRIINQTVEQNNGECYTNEIYKHIEKQRMEEQARREQEELAKKQAYEAALVAQARAEEQRKAQLREQQAREEERRIAEEKSLFIRQEEQRKAEQQRRADEQRREEERRREERKRTEKREQDERETKRLQALAQITAQVLPISQRNSGRDCDSLHNRMQTMTVSSPSDQSESSNYRMGGGHGGRFTDEYMSTTGSANTRPIWEGPRGGNYYINSNGNKSYLRR